MEKLKLEAGHSVSAAHSFLNLHADLKTTDLKILLLYRELMLLKDLEKNDRELALVFEKQRQEKMNLSLKVRPLARFIWCHLSSYVIVRWPTATTV